MAKGALDGVRVLDFGHYIPGPLLGMFLSDQGASVIKVERPDGDPARKHPAFATWNRGKQSVALDLKSEAGQTHARTLAANSDVVIENFRPGVADRLGIGYEALSEVNPKLVYCSLPGFGEGSPHRHSQGWEPIVGAATGLYEPARDSDGPVYTPVPAASTFSAIIGAVSVTMALIARHRNGKGQRIEVPLHSAIFAAMGRRLSAIPGPEQLDQFQIARWIMNHQYQCKDGRWVQHHGMFARFFHRFLNEAGHPEWIEETTGLLGKEVDDATGRMWLERFEDVFRQRTAEQWEDDIGRAGGACVMCRTVDEWLEHDHAKATGMVVEVDDAVLGRMKQPGLQVRLHGTPGAVQGRAPILGEHTSQVLGSSNTSSDDSADGSSVEEIMSALQGVKVLDLCLILAGPTCGRTLAEFGAEVIKIDDPERPYDITQTVDVNRAKRSLMLDLKTEKGKEVFWRLLEDADVVVENNRAGAMERMGMGYEDIKKRRPDIIYASMNTYGYGGPWTDRAGWEQLAQATTGIQVRQGGRDGAPTVIHYTINDYGTGISGAFAVALALYHRNRTGDGQSVSGALSYTACTMQSPFFLDYEGHQRKETEGLQARGSSALSSLYKAADGWLYLHAVDEASWTGLTGLGDFSHLAEDERFSTAETRSDNDSALAAELAAAFAQKDRAEWLQALQAAGISAIENLSIPEFRHDSYVRQAGLIVNRELPALGAVDHLGVVARLSGTPAVLGSPSPVLGEHTDEILRDAGYSEDEITDMKAQGVAVQTMDYPGKRV